MYTRTETRPIKVGNLSIGHQNQVIIQSMTNTKTKDIKSTVNQINALANAGCQIVRLAVLDQEDAQAIYQIKLQTTIPLVADIHFDYQLALTCIRNGIDKIRINPGNIGNPDHIKQIVDACQAKHIPIRIGINAGSLEKSLLEKYGHPSAAAMIESAQGHINLLTQLGFEDICLSFKSSDPELCIETYQLAAETFPYPLHLGVTEAGSFFSSAVRSSAALGALLYQGIGDTLRVSVSGDPVEEIKIAKELLSCFKLMPHYPKLISCPTCGRLQYQMLDLLPTIESYLSTINVNIKVAVMGCAVNGPGEAKEADIGVAGGINEALLFKKGQLIRKIPQNEIVETLIQEIETMIKNGEVQ
jgi:(E)-4-hydroxy-3-methylbut-2-enyl-diphosphate synthase